MAHLPNSPLPHEGTDSSSPPSSSTMTSDQCGFTPLPSFDELKRLADASPDQLELLRLTLSEEVIARAPASRQKKLRVQLNHINQVVREGRNVTQVNVTLMRELMQKFDRFARVLDDPEGQLQHKAKVLSFSNGVKSNKA